jgi:voltage-gated potassium channel
MADCGAPATPVWLAFIQRQVHSHCWGRPGLSPFNHLLIASLALAVLVQILETEPSLRHTYGLWFQRADLIIGFWFGLDFLLRFLAAGAVSKYRGWRGRLRYGLAWQTWMDLLAILPFIIYPWVDGLGANDLAFLRLFQGFKIVRAAHLGRLGEAMSALRHALRLRRYELILSFLAAFSMMLIAAVLLYLAEGRVQPNAFGSIPRALWWAKIGRAHV